MTSELGMLFDWLVVGHVLDINPAHVSTSSVVRIRRGGVARMKALARSYAVS
jgi:hypothetical protein